MPQTSHIEKHFTSSETVRDIVIGMSDGLTVPFALAAGLSGAVAANDTWIVITAGLAEIAAGSIAMGLGGYPHRQPLSIGCGHVVPCACAGRQPGRHPALKSASVVLAYAAAAFSNFQLPKLRHP